MGVKLMTGATGEQNIEAADDRECLAGITGLDSYVFDTGSKLKATLVDANTITIGTGAGSMQGSRFRCPTATTVTIRSGTQGQYRHDIIGLHFSRESSGKESLEFQALTGEPAASEGAAEDPAYTVGDLLKGDAEAFFPLYRVKLSGINADEPVQLFATLETLKSLQDARPTTNVLYDSGGWTISERTGIVFVSAWGIRTESGPWSTTKCPYVIPAGKRPVVHVTAVAVAQNGGSTTGVLIVEQNGEASVRNYGGTGTTNARYASLSYPTAQR